MPPLRRESGIAQIISLFPIGIFGALFTDGIAEGTDAHGKVLPVGIGHQPCLFQVQLAGLIQQFSSTSTATISAKNISWLPNGMICRTLHSCDSGLWVMTGAETSFAGLSAVKVRQRQAYPFLCRSGLRRNRWRAIAR